MSLPNSVIDALVASGCTTEQLAAAMKAANGDTDARAARKREVDAARKRRQREADRAVVTLGHADIDGHDVTAQDNPSPKKETPPAPPKEKTTPSQSETNVSSKKRAARLPADWTLPTDWRQDAIDAGLPADKIELEANRMLDWSLSSPGGAKLDWRATWRNWARAAAERLPKVRGSPQFSRSERPDHFANFQQELIDGQDRDDRSDRSNRDDAQGVPVLTIDYHRG